MPASELACRSARQRIPAASKSTGNANDRIPPVSSGRSRGSWLGTAPGTLGPLLWVTPIFADALACAVSASAPIPPVQLQSGSIWRLPCPWVKFCRKPGEPAGFPAPARRHRPPLSWRFPPALRFRARSRYARTQIPRSCKPDPDSAPLRQSAAKPA